MIKYKRLPAKPPALIFDFAVVALVLDRFNAPTWAFYAVGAFFLFLFVFSLAGMLTQEEKDVTFVQEAVGPSRPPKWPYYK